MYINVCLLTNMHTYTRTYSNSYILYIINRDLAPHLLNSLAAKYNLLFRFMAVLHKMLTHIHVYITHTHSYTCVHKQPYASVLQIHSQLLGESELVGIIVLIMQLSFTHTLLDMHVCVCVSYIVCLSQLSWNLNMSLHN